MTKQKAKQKPRLKNKVLGMVKSSPQLKGELIIENNVHEQTLTRWIRGNSSKLTQLNNLQIISRYTEMPLEQLTEK